MLCLCCCRILCPKGRGYYFAADLWVAPAHGDACACALGTWAGPAGGLAACCRLGADVLGWQRRRVGWPRCVGAVDLGLLLHYLVLVITDQLLIICHYVFDEERAGGQRPGQ